MAEREKSQLGDEEEYELEVLDNGTVLIHGETPGDHLNYAFTVWLRPEDVERIHRESATRSNRSLHGPFGAPPMTMGGGNGSVHPRGSAS